MPETIVQQPIATEVQEKFSGLPTAEVDRSTFDMSHPWKGTLDTWMISPVMCMEVLPGDTFNVNSTIFARLATPIKPIMDSLTADVHYFFVPNRLVWDNWQFFMGERIDPDDDPTEVTIPQVEVDFNIRNKTIVDNKLGDCFGLPLYDHNDNAQQLGLVNALPFRAYALIYNEWYRNENLEPSVTIPRGDGPDKWDEVYTHMRPRHKRADYFTRALPWPQKGDPVFLPLGTWAPVQGGTQPGEEGSPKFETNSNMNPFGIGFSPSEGFNVRGYAATGGVNEGFRWADPELFADLTVATAATINDIRTAFQIQKLLERDARGGTRYIEIILSHFNVQSPDMRLQRPEYLGGGSSRITINPVAATVATEEAPQGNLAAVGTGLLKGGFTHSFTEHGYILALFSCRSDLTYQTGLERHWSRKTRYDYYWPSLSHLGEQAILNKEIFFKNDSSEDDDIWGYQERFAEYRYQPGRITGKFRSEDPASLDVWHLSQDFQVRPELNPYFTSDFPPMDRVVAVPSEPDLLVDCWHNVKATRPMPVYAVPGLVDHF